MHDFVPLSVSLLHACKASADNANVIQGTSIFLMKLRIGELPGFDGPLQREGDDTKGRVRSGS